MVQYAAFPGEGGKEKTISWLVNVGDVLIHATKKMRRRSTQVEAENEIEMF